ncbi:hypothetical protein E4U21_005308 [Claviceps maximensis]|nr:hypothetical protein E4U21_005308 [Claviceps maximensis]
MPCHTASVQQRRSRPDWKSVRPTTNKQELPAVWLLPTAHFASGIVLQQLDCTATRIATLAIMGLVDYDSDSDSDSASGHEATHPPKPTTPKSTSQGPSKKPFRKVVDRSNPGKILVSLPTLANDTSNNTSDEPPVKRARTNGGGGLFSGFNSFLPPPKNTARHAIKPSANSAGRPGVNLKTSAAPGFSRDDREDEVLSQQFAAPSSTSASISTSSSMPDFSDPPSAGFSLPPPKRQQVGPSIPEGQKPAEEVKLVGKPLMFRPLSVGMSAKKKKNNKNNKHDSHPAAAPQDAHNPIQSSAAAGTGASTPADASAPVPQKKSVSLFSMHTEEPAAAAFTSPANDHENDDDAYKPLFGSAHEAEASSTGYWGSVANEAPTSIDVPSSLDHMADDLNLSAAARRELFGRDGSNFAAKTVVNFNMDKEYQHNEHIRASGDQQMHNPVRALQGSGKHSLKQLVQNVQNQKDALEDSFAKGRSNRKEASSRYGW